MLDIPQCSAWPYVHVETVAPGRTMSLRMDSPWLCDAEETLPIGGGIAQRVQIGAFSDFGLGLVIDGQAQLAEAIDPLYTTALVFPAALAAAGHADWLIVGGGDGAACREALRLRGTRSVQLVDASRLVIAQTQALVPSFWDGAQHDPRLRIACRDAWDVLTEQAAAGARRDIVLFDLTDPGEDTGADHLYTDAAFGLVAACLRPGGVFVAQVQELSLLCWRAHARLRGLLRRHFRHVRSYRLYVEYFGYWESFLIASNAPGDWSPVPDTPVEPLLAENYLGFGEPPWSTPWHRHLFALPPSLERVLGA